MIFLLGEEAIPKRIGYTGLWPKTGAIHANTTITAVYTKDCDIIIPPQPTSPGEIMSGGDGEPVENLNGYLLPYDTNHDCVSSTSENCGIFPKPLDRIRKFE